MRPRVLAIARTSSDEQAMAARRAFEDVADVELIDCEHKDARALIARLGIEALPAWLYPLGEGLIVAVGAPGLLVERLRTQVAAQQVTEPTLSENQGIAERMEAFITAALSMRADQEREEARRVRLGREEVLTLIDERADELHPATQISRLTRRLNSPDYPVLTRSEDESQ